MKFSELSEARVLGQGMSKAARAADVEQSDREYIAQRQMKDRIAKTADELRANKAIESVTSERRKNHLDVRTKKGDVVRFTWTNEWMAVVQGQKNDIYCGSIGDTSKDILSFLNGLTKVWYREHDEHFDS
jgi:hypothetical protein